MDNNKRDRLISLLLTLLIGGAALLTLVVCKIAPASATLPHAKDPEEQEVFFADIEYKEIQTDPTPNVDSQPAASAASEQGGADLTDQGSGESVPDLVADKTPKPEREQTAKPEKPTPPAPTKEEIEEQKRAAIREKMGRATGLKAPEQQSQGSAQQGNAATGNNRNADGLGLDGRKRLNKPDPGIKNAQGKVWIRITVNAEGAVTAARFDRSSGFGQRESEVRQACVNASLRLKYTPDPTKPTQHGVIVWNIK